MPRSGAAQKRRFLRLSHISTFDQAVPAATFSPITPQNRFQLIQNRGEIASVSGYSRILGPQNAQNAKKWVRTRIFHSGRIARARAVRVAHSWPRSGPFRKILGPLTGTRRIFATGLGRSSLPWENQSWGASCDHRITGRGLRGL